MGNKSDESSLVVRNFPESFTESDIQEFMTMFDPIQLEIFVDQHAAFATFKDKKHAHTILTLIHQESLDGHRLFAEYASNNRNQVIMQMNSLTAESSDIDADPNKKVEEISEIIRRLYATDDDLNLNQPPPPYLRYEYPKVNRDIVDAISIALESIPKFYVQVLHLMNRMNLEPPFVPGDKRLVYESASIEMERATIATQTDDVVWQTVLRNKRKLVGSDESELESSESTDERGSEEVNLLKAKRKKLTEINPNRHELVKQKQKNLLKMQRIQKQLESVEKSTNVPSNQPKMNDAFELDAQQLKSSIIKIVVPEQFDITPKVAETTIQMNIDSSVESFSFAENFKTIQSNQHTTEHTTVTSHIWSESELAENRIPFDQLKVHPMYINYKMGEISNRLYVKNIAKEVTETDLRAIYNRYLEENYGGNGNVRSIDVRLMTSGRMKGQAFITFNGPYLNFDVDDESTNNLPNKYRMIETALNETNGLILKGKPLVVAYGKKK